MAQLPKKTLAQQIDSVTYRSLPRPHLGASIIAHPCARYLVYSFNWAYETEVSGKLNRIFRMGDDIENRIIEALESVGIEISGSQDQVGDESGHAGGSIDGIASAVPGYEEDIFLFEAKSMNHSNFQDMQRKGVQESKPQHYGQMQMYMGRIGLQFGLYVAMNKNTSELYIEMLPYDEDKFNELVDREADILRARNINEFPRISTMASWYQCKFCDAKDVCHHNAKPHQNCRTCKESYPVDGGKWWCGDKGVFLSVKEQEKGCSEYKLDTEMWE